MIKLKTSGAAPLLLNLISFIPFFCRKKDAALINDNASHLPICCLLLVDIGLSLLLSLPLYGFITERGYFTSDLSCFSFGAADMTLSLTQFLTATIISFDRYIITRPKWGKYRNRALYAKVLLVAFFLSLIWSLAPAIGYGKYSRFHKDLFCSLDWRQGNIDPNSRDVSTRYIAFLTLTCLLFIVMPVCIASSFYYSIIDHVDRLNRAEDANAQLACEWAPKNHIAKVGLGCLAVSVVPSFAYSVVCLNPPVRSDQDSIHFLAVPLIISRVSALLNPIFYIWMNPEIVPVEEYFRRKFVKAPPPPKTYHTINLIADLPTVGLRLLTPTVPRRQLPQIPPHLLSPNTQAKSNYLMPPKETTPLL